MSSFWDSSWETIDSERIAEYVAHFDLQADSIIRYLHSRSIQTVCDAGCGCGIYSLKLASNGFTVFGFDVSSHAVKIAQKLLESASVTAELKTASVLSTGYPDNRFDCVISRDVLDHMPKQEAAAAIRELYRIVRPRGVLLFTLDSLDSEYLEEPHTVNEDGDLLFTRGKWDGMVFHPYSEREILQIIPSDAIYQLAQNSGEITVKLEKSQHD